MTKRKKGAALWLERIGFLFGIFYILYWLFVSISKMTGMDFSGASHLLPAFLMFILLLLGRRSLSLGGLILVIAGLALAVRYYLAMAEILTPWKAALVTGGPFLLIGVIFLVAEALANRKQANLPGKSVNP